MSESLPEVAQEYGSVRDKNGDLVVGPRRSTRRKLAKKVSSTSDPAPPPITPSQSSNIIHGDPYLRPFHGQVPEASQKHQELFDESTSSSDNTNSGSSLSQQGAEFPARTQREHNQNLWDIFTLAEEEDLLPNSDFRKANGLPAEGAPPDPDHISVGDASPTLDDRNAAPAAGHGETEGEVSHLPSIANVAATPAAPTAQQPVPCDPNGDASPPLENREIAAVAPAANPPRPGHGE